MTSSVVPSRSLSKVFYYYVIPIDKSFDVTGIIYLSIPDVWPSHFLHTTTNHYFCSGKDSYNTRKMYYKNTSNSLPVPIRQQPTLF